MHDHPACLPRLRRWRKRLEKEMSSDLMQRFLINLMRLVQDPVKVIASHLYCISSHPFMRFGDEVLLRSIYLR